MVSPLVAECVATGAASVRRCRVSTVPARRPLGRRHAHHVRYGLGETMPPEDLRDAVRFTQQHRAADGPFDVAIEGRTDGATPDRGARHLAPYVQAGLTWWIEALGWWVALPPTP